MFRLPIGAAAIASLALCAANPPSEFASPQDGQAPVEAAKPATDVLASFSALKEEAEKAMQAWNQKQQELSKAAKEAGEEFSYERFSFESYRERAMKLAEAGDKETAPKVLVWLIEAGGANAEASSKVLRKLVDEYVDSPALASLESMLPYMEYFIPDAEEAAAVLLKIEKGSSVATLRGRALMSRLEPSMKEADPKSEAYGKLKAELLAATEKIDDAEFTATVETFLKVRELYGVGCTPEDIVGVDLDGVEFMLSDYRGKVVFLDFWGDW